MNAMDWKLGLSSCCRGRVDRALFEEYAANGIDCMEISLPYEKYVQLDWKAAAESAKATGVRIWSLHLPFFPFDEIDISTPNCRVRENTLRLHQASLEHAAALGIPVAVVHPSGEPNPENERAERMQYAGESLAALAEYAAPLGITIAVEDLPRTCLGNCSADILQLLAGDDRLRVCFDTNHLLTESNSDFIRAVGDKIVTLHVSDYDFRNERHWLPYEGRNDWKQMVSLLEQVGYSGPFLYEVSCNAPKTIRRRELTFADFRENHAACVKKRPFVPFGVPDEEACRQTAYYSVPILSDASENGKR